MQPETDLTALIRQLEQRLLTPGVRRSAQEVAGLLADEFIEFGSSGRVFDKQQVIDSLQGEAAAHWSLTHFKTSLLAPGVVLATYRATYHSSAGAPPVPSLRSSLWKWIDGRWQMVFHQGTLVRGE